MSPEVDAARFFERYGLSDVPRVSSPDGALYRAFGLTRGSMGQILGPKVIARGAISVLFHGLAKPHGDVEQMPGVFLVHRGRILKAFRHATVADVPSYLALSRPST